MRTVDLKSVNALEVLILVDNAGDALLASTEVARRPRPSLDPAPDHLLAEHGYSLLITVEHDGRRQSLLYDAGWSRATALHNLDVLGVRVADLRAIVLSHGHGDHHGGLLGMVSRVGRRGLPLVLHPDAWLERKIVFPDGTEIPAPPPSQMDLIREGVQVIEERGPTLLLDETVLITGQVERKTDFEPGFPIQYRRSNHSWEPDYMARPPPERRWWRRATSRPLGPSRSARRRSPSTNGKVAIGRGGPRARPGDRTTRASTGRLHGVRVPAHARRGRDRAPRLRPARVSRRCSPRPMESLTRPRRAGPRRGPTRGQGRGRPAGSGRPR